MVPEIRPLSSERHFLKAIGPGLLLAAIAVGVSHLVQSTRAGALYGFAMLIFIVGRRGDEVSHLPFRTPIHPGDGRLHGRRVPAPRPVGAHPVRVGLPRSRRSWPSPR